MAFGIIFETIWQNTMETDHVASNYHHEMNNLSTKVKRLEWTLNLSDLDMEVMHTHNACNFPHNVAFGYVVLIALVAPIC